MARDLISRYDALESLWNEKAYKDSFAYRRAIINLVNAPAVDAVEVVRCKDCANRGDEFKCPLCTRDCNWNDDEGCFEWDNYDETEDDGFCHRGVKKDAG